MDLQASVHLNIEIKKLTIMETRKTKRANLERKRGIFFQVGLIISLALAFLAFEWKSYDNRISVSSHKVEKDFIDILPPVTDHKKPEPKKPVVKTVIKLKEVSNDLEPDEEITIDQTVYQDTPIEEYIPMPDEDPAPEQEIFTIVEKMPEFPGGITALYRFLGDNIKYPKQAKEIGISGKVYVSFVVETDGSISNIKIERSPHESLSDEVLRVMALMPAWNPGRQREVPVRVAYNIPIDFSLKSY